MKIQNKKYIYHSFFLVLGLMLALISCNKWKYKETLRYYESGSLKYSIQLFKDSIYFYKGYYEDGKLEVSARVINKKLDGYLSLYYPIGRRKKIQYYKNGKKNGNYIIYYYNGNIRFCSFYHNDSCDGKYYSFYENGVLDAVFEYKNQILHGELFVYYNNLKYKQYNVYNSSGVIGMRVDYDSLGNIKEKHGYYIAEVLLNQMKEMSQPSFTLYLAKPPYENNNVRVMRVFPNRNEKIIFNSQISKNNYLVIDKTDKQDSTYLYKIEVFRRDSILEKYSFNFD